MLSNNFTLIYLHNTKISIECISISVYNCFVFIFFFCIATRDWRNRYKLADTDVRVELSKASTLYTATANSSVKWVFQQYVEKSINVMVQLNSRFLIRCWDMTLLILLECFQVLCCFAFRNQE